MTKQQIYNTCTQMQGNIHKIIYACHTQNYDQVVRLFPLVTDDLMRMLEAVFSELSYYNENMELVNPEGVGASLQDMLCAQQNQDYVLLADLLELQMIPFLQSLQDVIRSHGVVCTDANVWIKNMAVLEKRDAVLWKQLSAYHKRYEKENEAGTWQGTHCLEDTNSGALTMSGQDAQGVYYYHSNVAPMAEAADFARYYYRAGSENYVIWGLGLGYHVRELLSMDEGLVLKVYENDLDVIYHCLTAVDMSYVLALPGFSIVYDPDFQKMIGTLAQTQENLILHYPSLRHIQDKKIREQMEMFFIRDSGKRNAAALFESNSRENFRQYDGYVDELRSSFEGKDVVIVAAGPSLDKNVQLLKDKKPNMVILAVETVFRKLIDLGIDVDYMIVTDANSRIYGHIRGLENSRVPMLYLATAYKGYAQNYQGKKYLICQNGYDRAEELATQKKWHLYETGGSVSTTALDICIYLNSKSIAFIGLDLAYTDNLAHAAGTARRMAGETTDMQQVPAIGGGTVAASRLFIIYNKWIEKRVKQEDVVMPVYDATEGGAVVPGLQVTTLEEWMKNIILAS